MLQKIDDAQLLNRVGVAKPLWSLRDPMESAPTFATTLQASQPRKDVPSFTPPYDESFLWENNDA